jgi:hypothetical protein
LDLNSLFGEVGIDGSVLFSNASSHLFWHGRLEKSVVIFRKASLNARADASRVRSALVNFLPQGQGGTAFFD